MRLKKRYSGKRSTFIFLIASILFSTSSICSQTNGIYTLQKGDLSISVSTKEGGKVISFKKAGEEMLLQKDIQPKYYGSTLWLSPQRRFWPPSDILDNQTYQASFSKEKLRLKSQQDKKIGFRIAKEFEILKDTSILIRYTIENISDQTQYVAPWDVTRVNGGLTCFLVKKTNLTDLSSDLNHVQIKNGMLYYRYEKENNQRGQKLFAITSKGKLYHYYKNLVFIKQFPRINEKDLPERQGEVEIFLSPNSSYIELENHGKYTKLLKGKKLTYTQRWYLLKRNQKCLNNKKVVLNVL